MGRPLQKLQQFFGELKRRNVYKVAVAYVAVAFVAIQAADLLVPQTTLPGYADNLLIYLAVFGFPIALVVAWAFEVTPEGVRRTTEAEPVENEPEASAGTRTAYKLLVGLGLLGAAIAGGWYLTGGGESDAERRLGDRSIAVLPFEELGEEAEPGTFTEGMHDDLLARLSNVSDLKVISRTTVQQYRNADKTTGEIARELGVRWVLEGGVQEMGDQIQVNAQLIDPRTDTHTWADTYRRDLTTENLFAIQSELTKKIARSLEAELTTEETERVERQPTEDLEAYRLYVRGRSHLDQRTEQGMRSGTEFFRRAIEQDSSYALAWSGLADARTLLAVYGHGMPDTLLPVAREAARRAIQLTPNRAEGHASLGFVFLHLRRDGPAALREFRRAVELKPSYARAHHWLGVTLQGALGQNPKAVPHLERAADLDPRSPSIRLALASSHYYGQRLEKALEGVRVAQELEPDYSSAPLYAGWVLLALNRHDDAIDQFQRVLETDNPTPSHVMGAHAGRAVAYHGMDRTARARELLTQLEDGGTEGGATTAPLMMALVHTELGNGQVAVDALRRVEYDNWRTGILRYEPLLDPLRGDPRFQDLIGEVNQSWGLDPDGSLPDSADVSFGSETAE